MPQQQHGLAEATARDTLAAVVECADAAIAGLALDGRITAWNSGAEQLFGYSAAEVMGRSVDVLGFDRDEPCHAVERVLAGERGVYYEARRRRRDGTPVEVSINAAAIRDGGEAVTGVCVVARDISVAKEAADRQRALEERTHQAQRMESLGKLAGGVAHDFNNILAIILNYTEFAIEATAGQDDVQADLAYVRTATDRAMNLTRQLLTFTRGDTIQPQDVDLAGAIAETRAMLARTIGADVTLYAPAPAAPVTVHADPGQLQQVLLNLAINARDAMPEGGTLVIEADVAELGGDELDVRPAVPAGRYARIRVSDTGEGMTPNVAGHIFEPFWTTKPRGQGTGLGLATVYGIVSEAGGTISVYSELGVGTTFRIFLPLVTGSAGPPPVLCPPAAPPRGDGRTVLVVEDEESLARVVHRILAGAGYRVLTAANGAEGLAIFRTERCDALLTDVIMPEMSGPRLAELVHEKAPSLPVLYMSGYSNGLLGSARVLDSGIPFLEKPFTATDLLCKLHDALAVSPDHYAVG